MLCYKPLKVYLSDNFVCEPVLLKTPYRKDLGKAKLDPSAKIASVDCTQNRDICRVMGIRGFPTLLMLDGTNKKMIQHRGPRDLNALVGFAQAADPREDIPDEVFSKKSTTGSPNEGQAPLAKQVEDTFSQVKQIAAGVQSDVFVAAKASQKGVLAVGVVAALAGLLFGIILGRSTAPSTTVKVKGT